MATVHAYTPDGIYYECAANGKKYTGDEWNAFYEGAIETFAIQLSEVLGQMIFTREEINRGNGIHFSANRIQYSSNSDKLQITTQLMDRGLMMLDEGREVWNMPPLPDGKGQVFIIRGEYKNAYDQVEGEGTNADQAGTGIPSNEPDADPQPAE